MERTNFAAYDTRELWRKDRDHYIHPWTNFATFKDQGSDIMAEAEGVYVYNADGDRFIDGIGGLWCVNIGYGRDEMPSSTVYLSWAQSSAMVARLSRPSTRSTYSG